MKVRVNCWSKSMCSRCYLLAFALLLIVERSVLVISQSVLSIQLKDFNETMASERMVFVHFYTDWCAYCSSLNPVLEEVAQELHRLSINVTIGRIDVTLIDSDQLMAATESISIVGYPTLLLYRDGGRRITEYHGSRTAKDMVDYLKLKANWNVHSIRSFDEMMPFISQFELGELYEKGIFALVLGVFPSALHSPSDSLSIMEGDGAVSIHASSSGDSVRIFLDVAANFEYALFFLSEEASLLEYFNFPELGEDKLLVFQEFNEDMYKVLAVNASTSSLDIMDFLLVESLPVSIPFSPDTQPILSYLPIKSHALIFCEQVECEDDQLALLVDRLSLGYKGKLVFVEVGPEHYQMLSFFQVKTTALPQLIIANMTVPTGMAKYSFSDFLLSKPSDATSKYREATSGQKLNTMRSFDRTTGLEVEVGYHSQHLEQFLDLYVDPTSVLKPSLFSQSIEEHKSMNAHLAVGDEYVENLIGDLFYDRVVGAAELLGVNSFVYFHAPWCGHCKMVEPVISDLHKHFFNTAMDPSLPPVRIYRMDGTKNEVSSPGLTIAGYPSFFLFPAHDAAAPIEYNGARTRDAMQHFILSFVRTST